MMTDTTGSKLPSVFNGPLFQPRPSPAAAGSGRVSVEWEALPECLTRQRQGRREGYLWWLYANHVQAGAWAYHPTPPLKPRLTEHWGDIREPTSVGDLLRRLFAPGRQRSTSYIPERLELSAEFVAHLQTLRQYELTRRRARVAGDQGGHQLA